MREIPISVTPDDEAHWHRLRLGVVTSTEVSCLFGLNPYMTLFHLWRMKLTQMVDHKRETPGMKRGKELEDPTALWFTRKLGWQTRKKKDFMWLPESRIGSSYDWERLDGPSGPFEIKNLSCPTDVPPTWKVRGHELLLASPYIELQLQVEMMVMGREHGWFGIRTLFGNYFHGERQANFLWQRLIKQRVQKFYEWVEMGFNPRGLKEVPNS